MTGKKFILKKYSEIFKGGAITLTGTLTGYGLNYFFKAVSGRYLGPAEFGILAVGISIMTVFANLSVIGLNDGITRFIPFYGARNKSGRIKMMLRTGTTVTLSISLFIAAIIYLNAEWLSVHVFNNDKTKPVIQLFSVLIPFHALFLFFTGVMRGLKKMAVITLTRNIFWWGSNILMVGVIALLKLDLSYFTLGFFLALLLALSYYLVKFRRDELYMRLKEVPPEQGAGKELMVFSFPLTLTSLFQLFRDRTDILIIAAFLPAASIGHYYAAYPFAMILTVVLFSINRIINPVVSETVGEGNIILTKKIFKDFAVLSFQLTLPMFLFIFFFAEKIVIFAYGRSFVEAAVLLKILSAGYFLNAATGPFGEFLRAFDKTKFVFYISACGGVSNVVMMLLLIPLYGVKGAAFAALFSLVVMVLLGLAFCQKILKINPFNMSYFKTTLIGVAYFCLLMLLEHYLDFYSFLIAFIILIAVYIALLVYILKIVFPGWRIMNEPKENSTLAV